MGNKIVCLGNMAVLAAKCPLITEIRLLFPGIVDNLYWASNPSVYRMYTKLAKIWEANIFQQGTTDNARP